MNILLVLKILFLNLDLNLIKKKFTLYSSENRDN
jgi:hypothetical protein